MVFLFVPNLIGYLRFVLLFMMLVTHPQHPYLTVLVYSLSQLLDAFDGMAARYFNQCTKFGSVLDMVCDRASNAVLLAILGGLYPTYQWLFYGDIILDLTSHWFQMYGSLLCGQHHKEGKSKWWLLRMYYRNKMVLLGLVTANQVFLVCVYLRKYKEMLGWEEWMGWINEGVMVVGLIGFAVKKVMSIVQLISASEKIAQKDVKERRKIEEKKEGK